MAGQELHLTEHETLRITRETPEELEVEASWGTRPALRTLQSIALRAVGLGDR
jgi:hypothetical protein